MEQEQIRLENGKYKIEGGTRHIVFDQNENDIVSAVIEGHVENDPLFVILIPGSSIIGQHQKDDTIIVDMPEEDVVKFTQGLLVWMFRNLGISMVASNIRAAMQFIGLI